MADKADRRRLKVGVIGTGWVAGARHVPAFRRHPDVDVVAVLDRNSGRAQAAAHRWRVPLWFSDEKEFFSQDLDIVTVCTPPWTHAELACSALSTGLHVFTEKPMAMNEGQASNMIDASVKANRLLCVSHNFLFSRSVRRADNLIGMNPGIQHAFGLQMSSAHRRLPDWYQKLPGGLMLDESPHMIYTLQHFLGRLTLQSCRATWNPITRLPATVEIQVKGTRAQGQITMLFETPLSEWHIGLVNKEWVIDLDLFRDILIALRSDKRHKPFDILRTSLTAVRDHAMGFVSSGTRYALKRLYWGHDVIIYNFVEAALGRGSVPVDPVDSLHVVRLTDSILQSLSLA